MICVERTSSEWFEEAARQYLEGHQACAWCGGAHRVFKVHNGRRTEYYCNGCEFLAGHDAESESYVVVPGIKNARPTQATMCAEGGTLLHTHSCM
jgi:hypothetical protein